MSDPKDSFGIEAKLIAINKNRYERIVKEVDAAFPPLISALCALLDFGPSERSKMTKDEFERRSRKILTEFSRLYAEAFEDEDFKE